MIKIITIVFILVFMIGCESDKVYQRCTPVRTYNASGHYALKFCQ